MGVLDTFPELNSPAPAPSPSDKKPGFPAWAIALIVIFVILLLLGSIVSRKSSQQAPALPKNF